MSGILRDRTKIFILILVVCLFCIGIVWLNAVSSEIQYDINNINNKIQQTSWEIRTLEAKVSSKSSLADLEQRAFGLGMVHAGFNDIYYLRGDTASLDDLALALRENVYR